MPPSDNAPAPGFYSYPELALYLGTSESTIRRLIESGEGPVLTRIAGLAKFRKEDVEAWLARCSAPDRQCARPYRRKTQVA